MSQTLKPLSFGEREIILLGTAHISRESIDEVKAVIREENPDRVGIELDAQRLASIKDPESWRNLDISKVLKSGQGFVLMANLVLSSFQKRMGADIGIKPGEEMLAAITTSEELGIQTVMVDRPIAVTLRRAWGKNSLWGKSKLLAALLSSAFETEKISAEQIENLKNTSEMDSMMEEFAHYLPSVKEVLIDERDRFLASEIWNAGGKKLVAVLGAGHLPGVEKYLAQIFSGEKNANTEDIAQVPPRGVAGKIIQWMIPALILGLMVAGFIRGGAGTSLEMLLRWLLTNGTLAALGALIALGHPVSILVSFLGAPITSLNPFIGIGMVSGLAQAWVRKPKVEDMECLQSDALSLKGFYKNRILRILLVFLLSSVGSVIGTFVALPGLVSSLITQ